MWKKLAWNFLFCREEANEILYILFVTKKNMNKFKRNNPCSVCKKENVEQI